MYSALSPGAIGVHSLDSLQKRIDAAKRHGFGGVEIDPAEVAAIGPDDAGAMFAAAGIRPAGWGLPVEWRRDEETWRAGLNRLPKLAEAAGGIGCTRCMTWLLPSSDERPMDENRRFHVARFQPIAQVLQEHGCRLGLEFIGPVHLREAGKYPFIYRMGDMLQMAKQIGPNVGLLVDCWHWYTSGATVEDLGRLSADDVVYVHVNDAPKGIAVDDQRDNIRCLPGETGVIDIVGFLSALKKIGYDGPITPEPFKDELNQLPSDDDRLQTVAESVNRVLAQV